MMLHFVKIYKNVRLLQFMTQQIYFLERRNLPQFKNHCTRQLKALGLI